MMTPFEWTNAHSVGEAAGAASAVVAEAMTHGGVAPARDVAIVKAGGIDLLDLMKEGLLTPRRIVNLREIAGLGRISQDGGQLRIGSMVTLAQLARDPLIRDHYPALRTAAAAGASPQIRNMATIGGNLLQRPRCWYFRSAAHHCTRKGGSTCFAFAGDNRYHAIFGHDHCAIVHPSTPATVLVAFDAEVELTAADGATRVVALENFFIPSAVDARRENDLKRGEILTAVLLPAPPPSTRSAHLKQSEKTSFDWPVADVAVVLDLDPQGVCRRAAVVLGAAAPTPYRAKAAQAELVGQAITPDVADRAARAALVGATPLSQNAYKIPIFETLARRAILDASRA